jgi:hypothetical protein
VRFIREIERPAARGMGLSLRSLQEVSQRDVESIAERSALAVELKGPSPSTP